MIYAHASDGGIFIGLSAHNLELLKQGKPILRRESNLPILRIMYGETEASILETLVAEGVLDQSLLNMLTGTNNDFQSE